MELAWLKMWIRYGKRLLLSLLLALKEQYILGTPLSTLDSINEDRYYRKSFFWNPVPFSNLSIPNFRFTNPTKRNGQHTTKARHLRSRGCFRNLSSPGDLSTKPPRFWREKSNPCRDGADPGSVEGAPARPCELASRVSKIVCLSYP